jgi:hypothetical protein
MAITTVCPGCGGAKTARARLCATCRRRANSVGEQVWTESHVPPPPARPRTGQQSRIYYGKCASIARALLPPQGADVAAGDRSALDRGMRDVKRRALEWASRAFGREIASSTDLTEIEMERLLEHLDDVLDDLALPTPEAG